MPGQDILVDRNMPEFTGYLSLPPGGNGPGLIVLQEIFGVNSVMRGICDQFAAAGFVALCPDLFWRIEPGIQISDKTDEELQQAFRLYGEYDVEAGMTDIQNALDMLCNRPECSGKAGAIGFCLGGYLAYLTACRTTSQASVGYYGVGIENALFEADNLKHPLMLHLAEKDEFVPPAAQRVIHDAFAPRDDIVLHDYPGLDHAFARTGGRHYDADAAELANTRTITFLREHLV